jgi:hypothetical protein
MEEESSDGGGLEAEISEVTREGPEIRDEIAGAGTKDEPEEMDMEQLPWELSDGMGEGAAATGEASTEEPEEMSMGALPCELSDGMGEGAAAGEASTEEPEEMSMGALLYELSEGASSRTRRLDELSGKIVLELKSILIDILATMPQ